MSQAPFSARCITTGESFEVPKGAVSLTQLKGSPSSHLWSRMAVFGVFLEVPCPVEDHGVERHALSEEEARAYHEELQIGMQTEGVQFADGETPEQVREGLFLGTEVEIVALAEKPSE